MVKMQNFADTDIFTVHVKTWNVYKDTAEDVETRFDPSNFELDRPLPEGKNKKVIGLTVKFDRLRAKTYGYLKDNND